jgi:hypothetical protein
LFVAVCLFFAFIEPLLFVVLVVVVAAVLPVFSQRTVPKQELKKRRLHAKSMLAIKLTLALGACKWARR